MTDAPTPEQPIVEPPEAVQLPTEPDPGIGGDRFDQVKAEVDAKLDEIRVSVEEKLADAAEVARQAINELSDKVDALQARWDEHQGTS